MRSQEALRLRCRTPRCCAWFDGALALAFCSNPGPASMRDGSETWEQGRCRAPALLLALVFSSTCRIEPRRSSAVDGKVLSDYVPNSRLLVTGVARQSKWRAS